MSEQSLITAMNQAVQAKAAAEPAFRTALLANPRAAVESFFGTELPAHITLTAIEEAPDTYIIPVPYVAAAGAAGELSDSDLEAVAGGSKAGVTKFVNKVGGKIENFGTGVADAATKLGSTHAAAFVNVATGSHTKDVC